MINKIFMLLLVLLTIPTNGIAEERNGYLYSITVPSSSVVMKTYATMYGRANSRYTENVWYCTDNYWMNNGMQVVLKNLNVGYDLRYGGADILYAEGQSLSTITRFHVPGLKKVVLGTDGTGINGGVDCRILANAFAGYSSKMETIILNSPIVSIGDNAFDGLKSGVIICNKETPPELSQNAFNETAFNNVTVAVPDDSYDIYICSDWNNFKNIVKKSATSLLFSTSSIKMYEGEQYDLATAERLTSSQLHWTSSDNEIVEVKDGVLRAKKAGTATITATNFFENKASCEVIVEKPVSSITIPDSDDIVNSTLKLSSGTNYELSNIKVLIAPEDATDKSLSWHIENENIATIKNGEICPMQPGETVLKVTAKPDVYAEIKIVVSLDLIISEGIVYKVISKKENTCKVLRPVSPDLTSAIIPSHVDMGGVSYSVTQIADSAFYNIKSLESLEIPNTVSSIGSAAFKQCAALQSIKIPFGVTIIKDNTFTYCTSLTSVDLPTSLLRIGKSAFESCSGLTNVVIPNSVTDIDPFAFENCSLTRLSIPNSVKIIDKCAFDGNNLQSLIIEDGNSSLTLWGTYFSGCFKYNKIEALYVGRNISGWNNLNNTSELKSVELGDLVTSIGESAFKGCCGLTNIIIPNSVTSIESGAFDGCNLNTVICYAENPPKLQSSSFPTTDKTILYVLSNSLTAYKSAQYWKYFQSIMPIPDIIIEAEGISMGTSSITLKVSDTIKLTAIVLSETSTDKHVNWESNDEAVVSIDETGKVTAIAIGKTTITASDNQGRTASCEITVVPIPSEEVLLNKSEVELYVGEIEQLVATIIPENAEKNLNWSTSDANVASVSDLGLVTAVNVGKTIISVSDNYGHSASTEVHVKAIPAESISLNFNEIFLNVSDTRQLIATIDPDNATDKSLSWASSDDSVARVENGIVEAVGDGEALIAVSYVSNPDINATCRVIVRNLVNEIILSENNFSLKVGEFKGLTATVLPDNASNTNVTWTSSDASIASVHNGIVLAHTIGSAIIRVEANDESGIYAECAVEVTDITESEDITTDSVYITTESYSIIVHGLSDNSTVKIVDMSGQILYNGNKSHIEIGQHGIYFVIIKNKMIKVII